MAKKKVSAKKTVIKKTPAAKKRKAPAKKPAAKRSVAKKADRDIEKAYTTKQFVSKLRRLADSLEKGKNFNIQVAGERLHIPNDAKFNIEHERGGGEQEVEFQIKWKAA